MVRAAAAGSSGLPHRLPLGIAAVLVPALGFALASASGHGWQRVAMLLLLAPLLEETVFRAGLQEALLRRWHALPHLANAMTAVAFGLAHAAARNDATGFVVALPALLIGAVYQRTGRLRLCIALHAAMNASWLGWSMARSALPFDW